MSDCHGDADAWLLNERADTAEPTTKAQYEVRSWTLSKLSTDDLDFVRGYQPTVEVKLNESRRLLCFHGSPRSYDYVLLPETPQEEWDRVLGPYSPAIMTGGHTHTQQLRRVREGLFFNPGSVGVAYDRHLSEDEFHTDAWAEYAVLSHSNTSLGLEFHRVDYDQETLLRAIRASGRPYSEEMIEEYTKKPIDATNRAPKVGRPGPAATVKRVPNPRDTPE